jgi:hypothetical protein
MAMKDFYHPSKKEFAAVQAERFSKAIEGEELSQRTKDKIGQKQCHGYSDICGILSMECSNCKFYY